MYFELMNGGSFTLKEMSFNEIEEGPQPRQENQVQTTESEPSLQTHRYVPLHKIRFTWAMILLIWIFYLFGLLFIDNTNEDIVDKISPPATALRFYTISKNCVDVRNEVWRLFSNQFCHSSFQHIFQNTLILLLFGCSCEMFNGWFYSLCVFEAGVLYGTLAFSISNPFVGLVGCSHGIAGLLGGVIPNFLLNIDAFDRAVLIGFYTFLTLTVLTELLNYYIFPVERTAYVAHLFGFLGGFFVGLVLVRVVKSSTVCTRWKYGFKALGALLSITLLLGLLLQYSLRDWPPIDVSKYSSIKSLSSHKMHCCEKVFYVMKITGNTLDDIFSNSYRCH